ncbi:MAG: MAPEG family protein [Rhodobiaceae bacterium]|nr:MAPEG family protein [Rhodobiaceae bacterium]MCC0016017.1 MAPEG family protein [Rhodobiaceae bacterium]MCC0042297.1 MAPEG family protein [Rhodobiaceae bacterium]
MVITLFYGGILGLIFVWLSMRTINARRRAKVMRGDGGNAELALARGVHANTAEYVPWTLLLMGLGEATGVPILAIHVFGATLLVGRIIYVLAALRPQENLRLRVVGMVMTFIALTGASIAAVLTAFAGFFN